MPGPDSVLQYQLPSKGAQFVTVSVARPVPGPRDVSIRTKAVSLNPVDWKIRDYGVIIQSWPAVLGIDAAGVIEAVGAEVNNVKPGDEVFTFCSLSNRSAAFQEIITAPSHLVAKKPASLTFEEAASLPVGYLTGAAAVSVGLRIPLPFLDSEGQSSLSSILVLGGSSSVGAATIQLLRLAVPSATILTTSSAKHHDRLVSLGATRCFERSAQDDPSVIRAATFDGAGVDAIIDAVGAAAGQPAVFKALNPQGPRLYSEVATGATIDIPEDVHSTLVSSPQIFEVKGGTAVITALENLLREGKYKVPVKVNVVGVGFDAIAQGLDKLKQGASGEKYVVRL